MKKKLALILALMLLCLTACGKGGSKKVTAYDVPIPEGFEQQATEGPYESLEFLYLSADASSINMNIQPKSSADDKSFASIDADTLRDALEVSLQAAYGANVSIEDRYFTTNTVCGLPAYQYALSYDVYGMHLDQLIVGINADKVYTITYTDASGNWMDEFEDSAANIDLTLE